MNAPRDQRAAQFEDVSKLAIGRVKGLFEFAELGATRAGSARLFLLAAESGLYFAKFMLQERRLELASAPNIGPSAEEQRRQTQIREAKVELIVSCGLATITTVGSLAAGAPTGGLAWTITFAQGFIAWTECGLAVEKYRKLRDGKTPWVETKSGQVVNFVVKGADWLLVTKELGHAVTAGLGKRAIAGISDDIARPYAWTKTVMVHLPEFVLKTDNLLTAGKTIENRDELLEVMTNYALKQIESSSPSELKLPVYGTWCGPGHGGGRPIDAVDESCMEHDRCYGNRGYFDCQCDASLIQRLEAISGATLSRKGRVARVAVLNWFKIQFQFCRKH